jgi:hypothetical protein
MEDPKNKETPVQNMIVFCNFNVLHDLNRAMIL